jgi:tRNA 2-thiouridine synthesizing protein A
MSIQVINTLGMKCPQPVLKVAVKASQMHGGDMLEVLGDCPTFERDLRKWCERLGKAFVSVQDDGKGKKRIQIGF